MPLNIPKPILFAAKDPATKRAFLTIYERVPNTTCENCMGTGTMTAFMAEQGPYESPTSPYASRKDPTNPKNEVRLTSRSEIIDGKTKWWVGRTVSCPCPVCAGDRPANSPAPRHETFRRDTGTDR